MIGDPYQYCPRCAARLEPRTDGLETRSRPTCPSCGFIHYQNPIPAAGVIIVENGGVLLVERRFAPRVGDWTLPAGFVEGDEDAAACAVREAKEETNLDIELKQLFGVYSAFDDPRAAVVLILYVAHRTVGEVRCGDDASDARFFPLDQLPDNIAFHAHRQALADLVDRCRDRPANRP